METYIRLNERMQEAVNKRLDKIPVTVGWVRDSFTMTYVLLSGMTLITFIEALRTNNVRIRHMMNLETTVTLVAAFMYYVFMSKLDRKELDLENVTRYRYFDWIITTPMLILSLLLFYSNLHNSPVYASTFALIVAVDYLMLYAGYLGETGKINKIYGSVVGVFALNVLLYLIWNYSVMGDSVHPVGSIVYTCFSIVWYSYGMAYWVTNVQLKNVMYNVLDVIAKVFFGLFLWTYYGGVLRRG